MIDSHCHIYPGKIAKKAVGATDMFYGTDSLFCGVSEELLSEGEKSGYDAFVVQSVATSEKQVESINSFIRGTEKNGKGRIFGLGTLYPGGENTKKAVEQILSLGLHGVKLHPDIQRFYIDDPKVDEIYSLCEDCNLPILMHMGDARYGYSDPERLAAVAKKFPRLKVVAAHLGGWSVWEKAVKTLAGKENIMFDLSSCVRTEKRTEALGNIPYLSEKRFGEIIGEYGTDRVLFGTDYPMWSLSDEINAFLALGLSEKDNRMILSENAERVFSLS